MAREFSDLEKVQQADTHFKNGQWLEAYNLYKTLIGKGDAALLRSSESLVNLVKSALFSVEVMENNVDAMETFQNLDSEKNRGIRSKAVAISNEVCSTSGAHQTQHLLDRALLQHLNFMFLSAGIISAESIVTALFGQNAKAQYSEEGLEKLREILGKDNENIGANIELALLLYSRAMQDNLPEGESNENNLREAWEKCKIVVDAPQSTTFQRAAAFHLLRNIRESQKALDFEFLEANKGLERALTNSSVDTVNEYESAHRAIENERFGYFKETLGQLINVLKTDPQNLVANIQLAILLFERATQNDQLGDEKNTQDTKSEFLREAEKRCLVVLETNGKAGFQKAVALHLLADIQKQLKAFNLPPLEGVKNPSLLMDALRDYEATLTHGNCPKEQEAAMAIILEELYRTSISAQSGAAKQKVENIKQTPIFQYLKSSPVSFSRLITAGVIMPPVCPLNFQPTVLKADEIKDDNSTSAVVGGSHMRRLSATTSVEDAVSRSAAGHVRLDVAELNAVLKRRATVADRLMPVPAAIAVEEKAADNDPAPSIAQAHLSFSQEFSLAQKDNLWERFAREVLTPYKEAMRMNDYKSPKLNFAYAYALLDCLTWYGMVGEYAQETQQEISSELEHLEKNLNRLNPGEEHLKMLLKDFFVDIRTRLNAAAQGVIPAPQHPQKAAERLEALTYVANKPNASTIAGVDRGLFSTRHVAADGGEVDISTGRPSEVDAPKLPQQTAAPNKTKLVAAVKARFFSKSKTKQAMEGRRGASMTNE